MLPMEDGGAAEKAVLSARNNVPRTQRRYGGKLRLLTKRIQSMRRSPREMTKRWNCPQTSPARRKDGFTQKKASFLGAHTLAAES